MLSKNKIKEIARFSSKKYREQEALFIGEGDKLVKELLPVFTCHTLLAEENWIAANKPQAKEVIAVTEDELKKVSLQKAPQHVFALFAQPQHDLNNALQNLKSRLSLALDGIQDPGNMGTILRIADWFGIQDIFCSKDCVEIFNPKTIQATMGAIARVRCFEVDLQAFIQEQKNKLPIYGTFLSGTTIYDEALSNSGIIVMGNEGKGISPEIEGLISKKLLIPNYPKNHETSESLNVGVATAIICSEFRRRQI